MAKLHLIERRQDIKIARQIVMELQAQALGHTVFWDQHQRLTDEGVATIFNS